MIKARLSLGPQSLGVRDSTRGGACPSRMDVLLNGHAGLVTQATPMAVDDVETTTALVQQHAEPCTACQAAKISRQPEWPIAMPRLLAPELHPIQHTTAA
jgi:hypothetical protein